MSNNILERKHYNLVKFLFEYHPEVVEEYEEITEEKLGMFIDD